VLISGTASQNRNGVHHPELKLDRPAPLASGSQKPAFSKPASIAADYVNVRGRGSLQPIWRDVAGGREEIRRGKEPASLLVNGLPLVTAAS
jgi:hypothetical protein